MPSASLSSVKCVCGSIVHRLYSFSDRAHSNSPLRYLPLHLIHQIQFRDFRAYYCPVCFWFKNVRVYSCSGTLLFQNFQQSEQGYRIREYMCLDSDEDTQCCICLKNFVKRNNCSRLDCGHLFHKACISDWIRIKNQCPYCRQQV